MSSKLSCRLGLLLPRHTFSAALLHALVQYSILEPRSVCNLNAVGIQAFTPACSRGPRKTCHQQQPRGDTVATLGTKQSTLPMCMLHILPIKGKPFLPLPLSSFCLCSEATCALLPSNFVTSCCPLVSTCQGHLQLLNYCQSHNNLVWDLFLDLCGTCEQKAFRSARLR